MSSGQLSGQVCHMKNTVGHHKAKEKQAWPLLFSIFCIFTDFHGKIGHMTRSATNDHSHHAPDHLAQTHV